MHQNLLLILCAILWGSSTFLNRLSIEKFNPFFLQVIVGFSYIAFIPFALKLSGATYSVYKLYPTNIALTVIATLLSITANVIMYLAFKGNANSGSSGMIVALYPVITLLLSIFFLSEKLSLIKGIGVLTMIIGAILLAKP